MKILNPLVLSLILLVIFAFFTSCDKSNDSDSNGSTDGPNLIFSFAFDPDQERLNNLGQIAELPEGNAGQSPSFNQISAHYIELSPTALTLPGSGEVLYMGPETNEGGEDAVDFEQALKVAEGETFLSIPLASIEAGSYPFIRVSLSYQNYDVQFNALGYNLTGSLASFIAYNSYIEEYQIATETVALNANKLQGYWAAEVSHPFGTEVLHGQVPEGGTTVPNPLFATSPIPAGSCLVTGQFADSFVLTGNETEDIHISLSLSTNNSFEWVDSNSNNQYEPLEGEQVVDMGIRGLIPYVQ